ncbi:MAG: prepilin-type N-terminal cleavage/methylation domain-containing protein, partial [Rhodoferax sp.]|nr:prepilin-type N-terminal cleavage/methylation domain-containing protein [Rhodoferax sp.]
MRAPIGPRRLPRRKFQNSGFALIEAVVGMLIFSIGVLGLVALLGTMIRVQGASTFRAEASALSGELIGNMWADSATNRLAYASGGTACTYTPCAQWIQKVSKNLPKGSAAVVIDAATGVTT